MKRTAETHVLPDNAGAQSPVARFLRALYASHRENLSQYLRRKYGSGPPDPEDVVQQAFLRLARFDWASIEAITAPKSFLYRVAEHILIDEKRRDLHRARHALEARAGVFDTNCDFSPETVLVARDELAIVEKAIRAMSHKRRSAFLMHKFEDLSFAEIARRMNIAPPVARRHVEKALIDIQKAVAAAEKADS